MKHLFIKIASDKITDNDGKRDLKTETAEISQVLDITSCFFIHKKNI